MKNPRLGRDGRFEVVLKEERRARRWAGILVAGLTCARSV